MKRTSEIQNAALAAWLVLAGCLGATGQLASTSVKSGVIGSAGGALTVQASDVAGTPAQGLAGTSITIPAGALSEDTTIEIGLSTATAVTAGEVANGPVVDFGPSGLQLAAPATIQIPVSATASASTESAVLQVTSGTLTATSSLSGSGSL